MFGKKVKLKLRDVYGEQDSFLEQIDFDMKHVIDSVRMLYEEHKKDEKENTHFLHRLISDLSRDSIMR